MAGLLSDYFENLQHRATLLPLGTNKSGEMVMAWPSLVVDAVKSFELPGRVLRGDQWTPEDVTKMALDVGMSGGLLSRAVPTGDVGGLLGINVWQGGPHKYGPEGAARSLEHIGKGEGAQAYGWGRYDAGNPDVAQQYKAALGNVNELGGKAFRSIDSLGNVILSDGSKVSASKLIDDPLVVDAIRDAAFQAHSGANILEQLRRNAAFYRKKIEGLKDPDEISEAASKAKANEAAADLVSFKSEGYLYKHDLPDEDVARYLDWDKPIKGNAKLETLADKYGVSSSADGGTLYSVMESAVGKRGASEELGRAGIPGLKYYDGMSRNYIKVEPYGDSYQAVGLDGKGRLFKTRKEAEEYLDAEGIRTRNYVTWDQDVLNRMKLLERNAESF